MTSYKWTGNGGMMPEDLHERLEIMSSQPSYISHQNPPCIFVIILFFFIGNNFFIKIRKVKGTRDPFYNL